MKYMKTFLMLFVIFLIAYLGVWAGVTSGITGLSTFMFPLGLGLGAFFLMFLVCLVFKK